MCHQGGVSISGRLAASGSGKRTDGEVPVPQAEERRRNLARVVGAARRVQNEGRKRRALAVGDVQLEENCLEIELGVSETDIALAADRPAVTEQAVDLKARLHARGPKATAQAHRQPVVGVGGRVQAIMVPECGCISGRVLFRIGSRPFPLLSGVPIGCLRPLGFEKPLEQKGRPAAFGERLSTGARHPVGSPASARSPPGA